MLAGAEPLRRTRSITTPFFFTLRWSLGPPSADSDPLKAPDHFPRFLSMLTLFS